MTRIYQFTQQAVSGSVSGTAAQQGGTYVGTPWDTGRPGTTSLTRPTTRDGIYTIIRDALIAAGWTQYNKNNTAGTRDDVFESNGEDGLQNLCIRMLQSSSGQFINWFVGPKLNATNDLEKAIGAGTTTSDRWDLTASNFTADLHLLATKDFIHVVLQNINHTSAMFHVFLGNLLPVDANVNIMLLDSAVVAGEHVQCQVTGANPLVLGFRVGDVLQIVNVAKSATPFAETQVIVAVDTTSVTFRRLNNNYAIGARIGMNPCPIARRVSSNNTDLQSTGSPAQFTTPFDAPEINNPNGDFAVDNALASGFAFTDTHFALLDRHAQASSEFGSGTSGNQRTLRFTCRSVAVAYSGNSTVRNKGFGGRVPGLYSYNGTSNFYPHDYMREDRIPVGGSTKDYVPLRFTATSAEHYIMGPTPQ